tara:strand:+ start:6837 stop:7250 length:414 start_codon:yes stop_codon:yes gene_type:complete
MIHKAELVKLKSNYNYEDGSCLYAFEDDSYFTIQRVFIVTNAGKEGEIRGVHAHYKTHEIIVPVYGRISINVRDVTYEYEEEFILDNTQIGLYIPPALWRTVYPLDYDCFYIALCSTKHNRDDYIHNWEEYKKVYGN